MNIGYRVAGKALDFFPLDAGCPPLPRVAPQDVLEAVLSWGWVGGFEQRVRKGQWRMGHTTQPGTGMGGKGKEKMGTLSRKDGVLEGIWGDWGVNTMAGSPVGKALGLTRTYPFPNYDSYITFYPSSRFMR